MVVAESSVDGTTSRDRESTSTRLNEKGVETSVDTWYDWFSNTTGRLHELRASQRRIRGCSGFRLMSLCRTDTGTRNRDRISESNERASSSFSLSRALPIAVRFLSKTFTLGLGRAFNAPSTRFYVRRLRAISILILLVRLGKVSAGSLLRRISPSRSERLRIYPNPIRNSLRPYRSSRLHSLVPS